MCFLNMRACIELARGRNQIDKTIHGNKETE